jgi:hypothetical protein
MGETTRIESPECRGAWREGEMRCGEEGWTLLTLAEWMPGERRAEDRDGAVELLVKRTFWIADGPNAAQVLPVVFSSTFKAIVVRVHEGSGEGSLLRSRSGGATGRRACGVGADRKPRDHRMGRPTPMQDH